MASTKRQRVVIIVVVAFVGATSVAVWMLNQIGYNIGWSKSRSILGTQARSLEAYHQTHGHYPTAEEFDHLVDIGWWSHDVDYWGHPLIYEPPAADGEGFTLRSLGRDGKPGGDGLDADITNHELPDEYRR